MAPVEVMLPVLREVENRLVEEAVVEKKLVEVAEVEVELTAVKFWRVEEAVAKILERKEIPETVRTVEEAYGNTEARDVEVATKLSATTVPATASLV